MTDKKTLIHFFENLMSRDEKLAHKIDAEFDYFIDMLFEVNNSHDDFIRKFRILNYTKIRLESLLNGMKISDSTKKNEETYREYILLYGEGNPIS